jgi:quercetin dioxygenase-like cupin family protein
VRIVELADVPHRPVDAHHSKGFSLGALGVTADAHVVVVSLRPGGVIGRHPAAGRQLLVVLDGDATVSGADGTPVTIGPGQAAVWEAYESHETRSADGLLALVVEGELDLR